jgi:hypothetical protein
VTVTWPSTGEAYVYIVTIIPDVASGVLTVTPVAAGGGWIATIPGAGVKSPLLLPKPDATDFTLLCTAVAECSLVFF